MVQYDLLSVATDPAHHSVVDPRFAYVQPDHEMAQGSTIGAPRCCVVLKPTGAVEKIYSTDAGLNLFGAVEVHYGDRTTGIRLGHRQGAFHIHPERQDHVFSLDNGVEVHEQVFPFNEEWKTAQKIPPPAVYYRTHLKNRSRSAVALEVYGFCELRGNTEHDVVGGFDPSLNGIIAWNKGKPSQLRFFGITAAAPDAWEINADPAKVSSRFSPGRLSNAAAPGDDPIGVLMCRVDLAPGESRWVEFLCLVSTRSREDLAAERERCPRGDEAAERTTEYYWKYLERSVLRTPSYDVNAGVLWAKANMLRVQTYAPTGFCFTNDPTGSNNSVGRDTAWMAFGADYFDPTFARESLGAFFRLQQPSGKIVEYYDVRNDKTDDYGLNVNDNTPLAVLALWHHYCATGNEANLRERYPQAVKAMEYMLSQRNDDGLVWCTATGTSDWGIVGWRNVIQDYRISGASTEINSECFAALLAVAEMAAICDNDAAAIRFREDAFALRDAINAHLVNPENDLYLLTIDVDGSRRTDITVDLVFPLLFGVAPPERAARIVGALSDAAFWTPAGIRTVPRDAPSYGPVNGYGLRGGVWVAATYWFAFAAAKHEPGLMAEALATSFRHFSSDPRRHNTVPGQFSEWLHGEILSNQGMMLSPWDAPRYLWAAIEGAGGLRVLDGKGRIDPALADDWRWLTAINVPFRGKAIAWIACRMPGALHLFTTSDLPSSAEVTRYARDVTADAHGLDPTATIVAFAGEDCCLIFVGNTSPRSCVTAAGLGNLEAPAYHARAFSTISNAWEDLGWLERDRVARGLPLVIGASGFALVELTAADLSK